MPLEIRVARTKSDADAVFRLRYEVYVEELKRNQRYADHAQRTVQEPLDLSGNLFCAFDDDRLVGTVRTNYASVSPLGEYDDLYQMSSVGQAHPHCTSITTKLLVTPDHRNTSLAYRLAAAAYELGLEAGILFNFVDVYPERVPFFERLGYLVQRSEVVHSEYGSVVVMRLAMLDEAHLRNVGSPFLTFLLRQARPAA